MDEITNAIAAIEATRKTVNELTTTYQDRYHSVSSNVKELSESVAGIDDAVSADVKQVLSLARLPDISAMRLAKLLVGEKMIHDAKAIAGWIDKACSVADRYAPKPLYELAERLVGQNIHFPPTRRYPELRLKHLEISGGTDRGQHKNCFYLKGTVDGISSNQEIADVPLTFSPQGVRVGTLSFGLTGSIDRRARFPVISTRQPSLACHWAK